MGGVRLQTLAKGLEEAQKQVGLKFDVVSLHKIPRAEPGWSQFQDGGWTVYSHREECTWRGSGICYRTADWAVISKKSDERGIWLRLRRVSDGCHIWAGTAHLTQGSSKELHATEIHSFMMKLPPTTLPAVVGMDVNTPIGWTSDGYEWEAVGKENKGDNMLAVIREKGFCLTSPPEHQKSCPTCRPRKQDVQGRHIDVTGAKHCQHHGVGIVTDSHRFVGSDHDIVLQQVSFHAREQQRCVEDRIPDRGGWWEHSAFHRQLTIDQDTIQQLARDCTRPYQGVSYRDSEVVKVYFQVARQTRLPDDWKRALAERDKARREWKEERIRAANGGDWKAFRECAKRGVAGWEAHFADCVVERGSTTTSSSSIKGSPSRRSPSNQGRGFLSRGSEGGHRQGQRGQSQR